MKHRVALPLIAVVAAAGLGLFAPLPASASCAGPQLAPAALPGPPENLPDPVLAPGAAATVEGRFFANGCEDSYRDAGCGRGSYDDPQTPMRGVELTLRQGERSWPLGTADAADRDRNYAISWSVQLPADVAPGRATLAAATAEREIGIEAVPTYSR